MARPSEGSQPALVVKSAHAVEGVVTVEPPRGIIERLQWSWAWLSKELWIDDPKASLPTRALRAAVQLIALTVRGFQNDQILLRASALTYVTALSIIPMLGVVISVLGVVGGDETIVNFAIEQLTTVAPEARATVLGYASRLDFASFGTVGGAVVLGTAIFALRHLEQTLNKIWGVARSRSWARRFSDYLVVMVVAPISIGVAVSLATTLQSGSIVETLLRYPLFAQIYGLGLSQVPVFVLFLGFTFLFWFFPNTTVRVSAAALGGAVSAILFSMARTIYVDFQVGAATYQAVFGALSAVPLILAWLYVCWAVVLLGAEVAFAAQNLGFARREMRSGEATPAEREAIAVEIGVAIVRSFQAQLPPPTAECLADTLDEPVRLVRRLAAELERAEMVRSVLGGEGSEAEEVSYVPARPPADLTVGELLLAVRGVTSDSVSSERRSHKRDDVVADALDQMEAAWREVADQTSLEDLARSSIATPPEASA